MNTMIQPLPSPRTSISVEILDDGPGTAAAAPAPANTASSAPDTKLRSTPGTGPAGRAARRFQLFRIPATLRCPEV